MRYIKETVEDCQDLAVERLKIPVVIFLAFTQKWVSTAVGDCSNKAVTAEIVSK